jgi:hypothetical protein
VKARRSDHYAIRLVRAVVIEQIPRVHLNLVEGEFSSILASLLGFLPSLDHFIRSIEHRLRKNETDLFCRFQINHQLELRRLLDGKIARLGSF